MKSAKEYLLGVDIGTSATKGILVDTTGEIAGTRTSGYPLYQPHNGWAEQDPLDWKNAVFQVIKELACLDQIQKNQIKGLALSGQMHGLVLLDEAGTPLRNAMIWCDQRSKEQVNTMLSLMSVEEWMSITGNPPLAAWTAAKIMWIKKYEPQIYEKTRHILLPKDYIRYLLTGEFATDVSDASGMQLMDIQKRDWSQEVLKRLEIDPSLLGKIYESQDRTGSLKREVAAQLHLSINTVVAAGASDNAAAAVGTGVVKDGDALVSLGTSAVICTHLETYNPIPDGSLHLCCSAVKGCYHTMGGPQAAGLSLEWFLRNFCHEYQLQAEKNGVDVYDVINETAGKIPAGSNRLIYLPFLMGERTPHMEPNYRGAFIGLSAIHTKADLIRAIMEGVGYSIKDCQEILKDIEISITAVRLCGGGSKSPVWRQIMADLLNCDIFSLKQDEGPALGCAILAGVSAGMFRDVREACASLCIADRIAVTEQNTATKYKKYHALYQNIYQNLKGCYRILAEIDTNERK